jgi:tight adherence protein C
VEAGLDFMSAVRRNCEQRKMDPLNEELLRMQREIQIGTTRKVALHNLADRVRIPQLRTICSALIQADELGVGIGTILRIQAEQLRRERFERAEKMAHEAPTKMLFPLLLFIFPATLIILLGPVIANIITDGLF